ncbi:hypothetical protein C0J50_8492 [Silurus asotus]|uniref:Uncharacterized protein n=1 Tax=Silurus asotus TaxID=30991 RepID=A0AAD5FT15_SILAS|nr:hypothetical protein C0J50_8492 [Silurus asotus]
MKVTAREATEDEQRGINRAGPLKETGGVVCLLNLTVLANGKKSTPCHTRGFIRSRDATQDKRFGSRDNMASVAQTKLFQIHIVQLAAALFPW